MAASRVENEVIVTCEDFLGFQDALKKMRMVDDRIVYALNTTVPTLSFSDKVNATEKCKHLYDDLMKSYDQRETAIKRCISVVSESVNTLRDNKRNNPEDINVLKELRREQTKLRMMQSELSIEEVVKDRTLKIFYERCRNAYRPPTAPPL